MDIPEKKQKRIRDLIKSGGTAYVLIILSIFLGPVGPILMVVGFMYYVEAGRLLKKYFTMPEEMAWELARARKRFLWLGMIPLIVYSGLTVMLLVIIATGGG